MYDIVLTFITAYLMTFFAIPSIISVANKKQLVDVPGERRSHTLSTPSLGGIAIFAGTIFAIILWTPFRYFGDLQYILCAFIVIFLIGAKDDIDPIAPTNKFMGQFFAAGILIFFSDIRITSFYGLFGIGNLPVLASIALTFVIIILIINAFNLIDGINGLSGGIGVLMAITFGTWFFLVDRVELSTTSFALAGSVMAFLYFNVTPAKIFMGDTGSLLLGLVASILAINFIEQHQVLPLEHKHAFGAPPAVAAGVILIPIYDTLRVFFVRMVKGKSPFHPDRNHIHHLLLNAGMSHMGAAGTLILTNVFFICLVYYFQDIGTLNLLLMLFVVATLLTGLLYMYIYRKRRLAPAAE